MSEGLTLLCATGNAHKLREFSEAAGPEVAIEGVGAKDCPETGATFAENAAQKALCYSASVNPSRWRDSGTYLFADDSGIEADALDGAPGIFSARYAGAEATDAANNAKLLDDLAGLPQEQRTGRFVCAIALVRGDAVVARFEAAAEGRILSTARGEGGFGYDPLFYYPPLDCGFAELTPVQKWQVSHRGQAFRKMLAWLQDEIRGGKSL